jgi:hypothetical protein
MHNDILLEKQVFALNESFINLFKGMSSIAKAIPSEAKNSTMCQICRTNDHIATTWLHIGDLKLKCAKCCLPHKIENCVVKCRYCFGMGYVEDKCWNKCWKRGKDGKMPSTTNNYLEVLVNDENVTLEKLNHLCGTKHDIFTRARILKRCLHVESTKEEIADDHGAGHVDVDKKPYS